MDGGLMGGHLLVTGGTGFAMAHVARAWLDRDPGARVTLVDMAPLDRPAERFLATRDDRMQVLIGSVSDPETWKRAPEDVDYLVHGAAVTPHPFVGEDGSRREPEKEDPIKVLDANVIGAVRVIEWAGRLPALQRVVNVSSGSVYAYQVAQEEADAEFIREDRHVAPVQLYDISKYAAELICKRLASLYRMSLVSVRLSGVFGPLDRYTGVRHVDSAVKTLVTRAVNGQTIRVASTEAAGDFVYAPDVADGVVQLLETPAAALHHEVYNLAGGALVTLAELIDLLAPHTGAPRIEIAPPDEADIAQRPEQRTGRFGAYDISRVAEDTGWRPRSLGESLRDYVAAVRDGY